MIEALKDNRICRRILLLAILLLVVMLAVLFIRRHGPEIRFRHPGDKAELSRRNQLTPEKRPALSGVKNQVHEARQMNRRRQSDRRTMLMKFDSEEEYRRILEWALAAGIQIRGRVDALKWLKLSVTPAQAEEAARQAGENAELCEDVEMRIPQYLDSTFPVWEGDPGPAFGTAYLQAAGVDAADENRGKGVLVALLDTALLPHRELDEENIIHISPPGAAAGERSSDHGTAVASILCGKNGISRASLMAYAVLDENGCGSAFDAAAAIVAAADAGAQVISMSFGAYSPSRILEEAVEYAYAMGAVLVAAAGNNGVGQLCYPAAYENVIAVGAVDAAMNAAGFSNYGENLDVAAPGVGLLAATADNGYGDFTGTSAAVPCISGILANWLAENPDASGADAARELLQYANSNGQIAAGKGVADQWRMSNAQTPDIWDVAVNNLLYDRQQNEISVILQNCTAEDAEAALAITINGREYSTAPAPLPGQTAAEIKVKIPENAESANGILKVEATALLMENQPDARAHNQHRTQIFQSRNP